MHFESNTQKYTVRSLTYGLSPFVRYYFAGEGAHRFFGQVSAGLARQSVRVEREYDIYNGTGVQCISDNYATVGAALGYNYFLTPGAAWEVTAGYGRNTNGPETTTGSLDVRAGFSVFLPRKNAASAPATN